MLKTLISPLIVLAAPATGALAADVPDMTGTWAVSMQGVKIQKEAGPAPHNVDLAPPQNGPFEIDITVDINYQDGHSFSGTKASTRASEPIAGVVDHDNAHVLMVDADGRTTCLIQSADEMRCVYFEINEVNSIAGRQTWNRNQ